jgi:hypothetical protein
MAQVFQRPAFGRWLGADISDGVSWGKLVLFALIVGLSRLLGNRR